MLPEKLAFVDIETTGPRVTRDRIIEIGILRVENGQLVKSYQTLLNPQAYVSSFIEQYTGITKEELETAPTFDEIQRDLKEILQDCVFVAHNVRFDYGFLKNEFARYEQPFSMPHFCTVKLSRELFPQHPRHSLDALINRFGFTCSSRHRAYDDAKVMWDFLQLAQNKFEPETLEQAIKKAMRRPSVPHTLDASQLNTLPEAPGVYIFYGAEGYPLYVGKSKNIKERVLSHFSNDYASSKEMHMCQQVASIEALPTAGELGALLKESYLVKKLQPLYNRKLRQVRKLAVLKKALTKEGYETVTLEDATTVTSHDMPDILGLFRSKKQAKDFLLAQAEKYQLCHKVLGLEKSFTTCFALQLGKCTGACQGTEVPIKYNVRFVEAFYQHKLKAWPFEGPILLKESSLENKKEEGFIVDKWCLLGSVHEDNEIKDVAAQDYLFDLDTYKILTHYLLTARRALTIQPLQLAK